MILIDGQNAMSKKTRQRGRPVGSGIDDWERLLTIASVMSSDPRLKVTTAIKELGFSDPSVIRRLRDKFKAHKSALLSPNRYRPVFRATVARFPQNEHVPSM